MAETELQQLARRRRWFIAILLALLAMAVALQWSPARQWLSLDGLVALLRTGGEQLGPPGAVLLFALACMLAVPLSLLAIVTILAFGPLTGALYGLLGASLGAAASFIAGRWLGQAAIDRLAGPRLRLVSRKLGERGVLSVIAIRLVPAAPFAVVNMAAGASTIRLADFLLGNLIGMLPLFLISASFATQIQEATRQPGWLSLGLLVLTGLLVGGASWLLRRWLRTG